MKPKSIIILAMVLASLGLAGISAAQDQPEVVEPPGYLVCDWGTLVISPALRPPQTAIATPEVTEEAADEIGVDHAVNITSPAPYEPVAVSGFTITGTGKGLFENNVVVEVLDA